MSRKFHLHLLAPLTVSMVVITLGAAFGVLSGRGALIGMISTCIITLITAIVGGSRYGVSSPTGPMTAAIGSILVLDQTSLQTHLPDLTAIEWMNLTLIFSAIILFLLTLFRVHKLVKWVPNLVISGFVNGIALLIIIAQLKNLESWADGLLMATTLLLILIIHHLNKNFEHKVWQLLSDSFAVIVIMSTITFFINAPVSYIDLPSTSALFDFGFPSLSSVDSTMLWTLFPLAMELALIALLDTLLTAVIMDKKSRQKTQMGRELAGQSLSLFGVSLFGGLPGAQSTVPSMMLYQEKGHHRLSKLILAGFCILFTFAFAGLLQFIPQAIFGGIILKIALDVADLTSIKTLVQPHQKQNILRLLVTLGTTFTTVFLSLNLAVICFTLLFVFWNKLLPKKWHISDLHKKESEGLLDEV